MIEINPPPGIYRNGTELGARGRWYDGDLIRWVEGKLRPMKGWRARGAGTFSGIARGAIAWQDNSGDRWVGFGTASKLYVQNAAGSVFDVTPGGFTTGDEDAEGAAGYGYGLYGTSNYGVERPDLGSSLPEATTWSLDTWGQYLVGCSSTDGSLYEWQLSTGTPAAVISGAPTSCTGLIVTNERSLMALGADGDPRKIHWSHLENNTQWTAADTNQAGSFTLSDSGTIIRAVRMKGEILILTDVDVFSARYVGLPLVYRFDRVGNGGLAAANAVVTGDDFAVWMGPNGFYFYNGRLTPLDCDVRDYVFNDINTQQISKVAGWIHQEFNEVWWHYPSSGSSECDRYVVWNYQENIWYFGDGMARTSGIGKGTFRYPLLFGTDGYVYEHDVAYSYDGETPFAETGPIEIASGERVALVRQIMTDEETLGEVALTFKRRDYPTGTETSYGPYTPTEPLPVRFSGRQIKMRATGAANADWTLGAVKAEILAGGRR